VVVTKFVFYFLIIFPGTCGEMCVSRAMKTVGEVTDFSPRAIASVIGRAMKVPWFWIGLTMMTAGFFSLLGMLSLANVSFVFPATALSYAVGTLGGKLFLGERVTPQRWVGVALVCVGVALVVIGKG
jgi:drug/metabolite transporter (DMT)-like permease